MEKINDDDNFPLVEFDINGIHIVDEILFSHKEKDQIDGRTISFPLQKIDMSHNTIFSRQIIHNREELLLNDENHFKENELNKSIIKQIEENQYEEKIISAINGEYWNYRLSSQEKKCVIDSESFILSGRPGTGKTTIILFKLFSIFFNYKLKKNLRLMDNYWNFKNENDKNDDDNINYETTKSLRIVFTSLSQSLCEKQQNILEETMIRKIEDKNKEFNYYPISNTILKSFSSFRKLNKYPIFANFRKLMFMIDGSLTFQFFSRHKLKFYEGNKDTEYYYSKDNIYEVNKYSYNQKTKYIDFFYRPPNFLNVVKLQEANESTFINFYNNFLSKRKTIPLAQVLFALKLNPLEIYAQLISVIKGSYSSHLYMNNCISKEDYISKGRKITDLPNLDEIYDVCMLYEEYKKGKYFDIQDLVNFLIRQVKLQFKKVKLIDYLFIDEVQDLSVSQIYLLILVSKYCKVYAGDTCQTISKINRFRFSELNNIFYNFRKVIPNYPKIKNAYLCLNYRLNSKILKLSTFMAYLMKLLFPNTIDKFHDDFSLKILDQKPILLNNIDLIINNITNNQKNEDYTLSANHCFIYNSECDEKELNRLYKDKIYKLNIEEAKGLEFEMVIVYNFFSSSKYQGLWNQIFQKLKGGINASINETSRVQLTSILCQENIINLIETLNLKNIYPDLKPEEIKDKLIEELKDFVYPIDLNNEYDRHEIFEFCSELKQFYVIITRPKTFLVFYENKLNRERRGFYDFMQSKAINLITTENETSQKQFLENVSQYFFKINLIVKSPKELIILGNNEFNEGHYSRAIYLYKIGEHKNLTLISEIFYNEEILNEKINIEGEEISQLKSYYNSILEDINTIMNELEKKNLDEIIGKEENKINIKNVFEKMIRLKGKCLIYFKKYDEALTFYKKYNNNNAYENEIGNIYFYNKENFQLAYDSFKSIRNYSMALKSVMKMNKIDKILNYTNEISSYLGIIEYNNIYKKYINNYFKKYFTESKLINNEQNLNKYDKKNYHQIILSFFKIYLNQIYNFEKNKEKIKQFNENDKETIKNEYDGIKGDLNIGLDTIHFINIYYFHKPKDFILELIKLFPELILFKSTNFSIDRYIIDKLRKKECINLLNLKEVKNPPKKITYFFILEYRDKYYKQIEESINFILQNSEYEDYNNNFKKHIIPFLINHGYFYYNIEKYFKTNSQEVKLFFDFTLNNYKILYDKDNNEKLELISNNLLLSYLSYLLRIGITNFIKYKDKTILNNYLLKYYSDFKCLTELINEITNEYNISRIINCKNIINNLESLLNYLINDKEKELEKEEIIKYLDIGASLSLLLILKYFNRNYSIKISLETESLFNLFQNLYFLCNLLSSPIIEAFSYDKKLILFSLYSVFNASPLPLYNEVLQIKILQIFNSINGCLLNCNSILFNSDFFRADNIFQSKYFDIFSKDNKDLFEQNFQMFNLEGNNIIINYSILPILFRFMLSNLVVDIFNESYEYLDFTPNIFSIENLQLSKNSHFYSSILYYYNQLYFILNIQREFSLDYFWTNIAKYFSGIRFKFPFQKEEGNQLVYFYIDDYLKDLLLLNNVKPYILYSFLVNYIYKQKKGKFRINLKNINSLIFLMEEIWNIPFPSASKDYDIKFCYFKKLDLCLDYIINRKIYIFSSIIILRRVFPLILALIKLKQEKFYDKKEDFKLEDINIRIFSHPNEYIFDNIKKLDILEEFKKLKELNDNEISISTIISKYFLALKKAMIKFSDLGGFFGHKINDSRFFENTKIHYIYIKNYEGKGEIEGIEKRKEKINHLKENNNNESENKSLDTQNDKKRNEEDSKENNNEKNILKEDEKVKNNSQNLSNEKEEKNNNININNEENNLIKETKLINNQNEEKKLVNKIEEKTIEKTDNNDNNNENSKEKEKEKTNENNDSKKDEEISIIKTKNTDDNNNLEEKLNEIKDEFNINKNKEEKGNANEEIKKNENENNPKNDKEEKEEKKNKEIGKKNETNKNEIDNKKNEDEKKNGKIENEKKTNKESEKEKDLKLRKNIITFFDKQFYFSGTQKLTQRQNKLEQILGTFESGYKNNKKALFDISNEYYYLLEITFFCIYLTIIKQIYQYDKKDDIKEDKNSQEDYDEEEDQEEEEEKDEQNEEVEKDEQNEEVEKDEQNEETEKDEQNEEEKKDEQNEEEKEIQEEENQNYNEIIKFENKDKNDEKNNLKIEEKNKEENSHIKENLIINLENEINNNYKNIKNSISNFITTYEQYSLYINFIDEEGHKTYIKNKYDKIFQNYENINLYDKDYKSNSDLRKYFLENKNILFKFFDNKKEGNIKIFEKKVNFVENEKLCGIINNIEKKLLFNYFNENTKFIKGLKEDKVKNFFEKIEYNKNNTQERNEILKNYVNNYFNIIG